MPVTFSNPSVEIIIGPQLKIGEGGHTYFDTTQVTKGRFHANSFPAVPPGPTESSDKYINDQYYDQGLCQYALSYRSGDQVDLANARKVTDSWIGFSPINNGKTPIESSMTPRNISLGGIMLRALDGRPDMWDWIVRFTRFQFDSWVKRYLTETALVNGVRDGSYMLLYAAWLSQVLPSTHPNAAILKAEFLADAEKAASDYYLRLQYPDGSWRWGDDYYIDADGGRLRGIMQPFMIGLLLHALIDVYRVTTNTSLKDRIKLAVTKSLDHLFNDGPYMKRNAGIPGTPIRWRAFNYFYHGGTTVTPTKYANGDYAGVNAGNTYDVEGARQATSTILHAVGWAHSVTNDPKYLTMGDEYYDSIFGFKEDQISNYVAGNDPKGYNQHFRAGGRYLAYRAGATTPPIENPPPPPPPPPPIEPPPTPCSISAPESVTIPKNGTGSISITLSNLTAPVTVSVLGSDGQVTVSPLSKVANPTSSILAFQVRVKRQSRSITFQSPCGSKSVMVRVQ